MGDIFTTYFDDLEKRKASQIGTGLVLGGDNPDETAKNLKLATELGVPSRAVKAAPDMFQTQLDQKNAQSALTGAPKMSDWLRDPENGALAKDDLENLTWWEKGLELNKRAIAERDRQEAEYKPGNEFTKGLHLGSIGLKQIGTAAASIPANDVAQLAMTRLELYEEAQKYGPDVKPFEVIKSMGLQTRGHDAAAVIGFLGADEARREKIVQNDIGAFAESRETIDYLVEKVAAYSAEMEKTQGRTVNFTDIDDVSGFGDWLAFNTGQSIPFLAAIGATGLLGGTGATLGGGYAMGVGDVQAGLFEEGVTDRGDIATVAGVPYAALELLGPAAAPFRGVAGNVLKEVASGYFKRLGREVPKQAIEEFINEAGQEIIKDYAVSEGTGEDFVVDNDALKRWFNSGMAGVAGGASMSTVTTTGSYISKRLEGDVKAALNSDETALAIAEIDEMASASKLKQRSPEKFADAIEHGGLGEKDFYVSAEGLQEYFQAKDMVIDAETLAAWGIEPDTFAEKVAVGGDVVVPASSYAANISGTDDSVWFRDNSTFDPDQMSTVDAANFDVNQAMQEAFEASEQERRDADATRTSELQIYDDMVSQLRSAGQSPDAAKNQASLWSSFFTSQASRTGEDALDLARMMGVQVRGQDAESIRRRGQLDADLNTLRKGRVSSSGQSLIDFIIAEGGLQDAGGDLQSMDAPRGLIAETRDEINARQSQASLDGMPSEGKGAGLDDMARRVIEAGYFPDLVGETMESAGVSDVAVQTLSDAISEGIAGRDTFLEGEGYDANLTALSGQLQERGIDLALSNDDIAALLDGDGQQYNQDGQLLTDTPEFKAWFGDSKVVDANGDPLVVYHGTRNDFEAFDTTKGMNALGAHFGDAKAANDRLDGLGNKRMEARHGVTPPEQIYPVYLSIKNPIRLDDSISWNPQEVLSGISWALDEMGVNPKIDLRDRFDVKSRDIVDALKSLGFDGVVYRNDIEGDGETDSFIAFDPTQIKSVHNRGTFDANDPRILYQGLDGLDDAIAEYDDLGLKPKPSDEVVDDAQPLALVHNLSQENLKYIDELGGMAAPSLAVIRGDIGFDNFGEITLVAKSSLGDPKKSDVKAFNADVYSPRQPRPEYKITQKAQDEIENVVDSASKELSGDYFYLNGSSLERGGIDELRQEPAVILSFLRDAGKPYKVKMHKVEVSLPKKLASKLSQDWLDVRDDPEQLKILSDHFGEIADKRLDYWNEKNDANPLTRADTPYFEDDGVTLNSNLARRELHKISESNKPPKASSGNRSMLREKVEKSPKLSKQYDEWLDAKFGQYFDEKFFTPDGQKRQKPYELDEIVKAMTKVVRNGEGFNYGVGNIRSVVAKEFKSLSQVESSRADIVSTDDMVKIKEELNHKFDEIVGNISSDVRAGDVANFIIDVHKGQAREWSGAAGFDGAIGDEVVMSLIKEFTRKLRVVPTEYFEVKMQRSVGLDEFEAAIVPQKASKETIDLLKSKGLKVVKYGANKSRNDALKQVGKKVFFQDARGSIVLPKGGVTSDQTIINLFESANLSTFLHESGHFFLEAFTALADVELANDGMQSDLQAIHKFLDVKDGAALTVEQHEKWARGFEAYLMEGKAPSLGLMDAFSRFKAWLTQIYKTALNLNVKLTPEIREVMDRMLATDAQIAEVKADMEQRPLFTDASIAGMSKAEFKTYQRLAQRSASQAEAKLLEKTMAKVRREKEKWFKEEKSAVRFEVEQSLKAKREFQLVELVANQRWLDGREGDTPDIRLNRAELVDVFGEGILSEISRTRLGGKRAVYAPGGDSLNLAAEFFGFSNSVEMVETLQNTPKLKDAIRDETDRRMLERHGDVLNDGKIEEEALQAIHSERQMELMSAEARALAKRAGKSTRSMSAKFYKARAREMLGRMTVREASRPSSFLQAERKASRKAQAAFASIANGTGGKPETLLAEATIAKEQQILNGYLYRESQEFEKRVKSAREHMMKLNGKKLREKIGQEYIVQIDALVERFDFRVRTGRQVERAESLREFVDRMIEDGREAELAIPESLLNESKKTHYSRLSMSEFQGLIDTISNLEHMGKRKGTLQDRLKKRQLSESVERVAGAISKSQKPTASDKQSHGRQFLNLLRKPDTIMVALDGGEEIGAVYEELKEAIDAGQSFEQLEQVKMAEAFDALYSKHYSKKEIHALQTEKKIDGAAGKAWSKSEILSLALNMGAADNYQRVTDKNAADDYKMDAGKVDALLSTLDENDWRFVQGNWDLVNSYWPDLSAVHKRRTGLEPQKVEAKLMYEGAPDFVKGGYYPIKYDPTKGKKAAQDEASSWDKFLTAGHGATASVRNGMTKDRQKSGGGRTILYDLSVPITHLRETVRYIALSEAVDNSYRVLNHKQTVEALQDTGHIDTLKTLNLWLKDTAQGPIYNTDLLNSAARMVKNNFTISRLAFNLKTVVLQATGLGQSAAVVGKRNMAKAMGAYMKNPSAAISDVVDISAFMAERQTTFQKDIYDFSNDLKVSSPMASRWSKGKSVVAKAGFWPLVKMQFLVVDMPTWLAGYQVGLGKYKGNEQRAVSYADRMVARAQDSALFADRAAVERGTVSDNVRQADFIRLFTTLAGYMLTKFNRLQVTGIQSAKNFKEAETATAKLAAATSSAVDVALLLAFEAAMMGVIYALMSDSEDEEDIAKFMAGEIGMAVVGGIPIVRDSAAAFNGYGGGGVYGSVLEVPAKLYTQAVQGENDKQFRRAVGDAVGVATGLPSTATLRLLEGLLNDDVGAAEMLMGYNPLAN